MKANYAQLEWLAFRYIADELTDDEKVAFEERLLTDQSAREAVAEMVRQTQLVSEAYSAAAAGMVSPASSTRRWHDVVSLRSAVSLCSSLVLLVVVLLTVERWTESDSFSRFTVDNIPRSTEDLAYAWAETRGQLTELQLTSIADLPDPPEVLLVGDFRTDREDISVTPSWMLAALAEMTNNMNLDPEVQE